MGFVSMQGFCRQVLPVATRGDVSGILMRSSDGRVRPPICCPNKRAVVNKLLPQFAEFISVMRQPPAQHLPGLPLQWEEATHTSRAALRPGKAAVVRISAGLDCEAVSLVGSVVMPGSASFMPQTTA